MSATVKKANGWPDIVVKLTPLLSVLIAVGGLVFSVIQYNSQKEREAAREQVEQVIRIHSQIRNDLDQIAQFPNNKALTISGAEFILRDLDTLLESQTTVLKSESATKLDRRKITKSLYDLAFLDCNFDEHRDVHLSIALFDSWGDYKNYLKEDPDLIWDLLLQYNDALSKLREKFPKYISQMEYNKAESAFIEPYGTTPAETAHLRQFEDLVRGFNKHLDVLDQASTQRKKLIEYFQSATCNKNFTQARFGWSVDPNSDRDLFRPCL